MAKQKIIDKENLRQVILGFPDQFETGFNIAKKISLKRNYDSICISGMGGSSLPMDILKTYIAYLRKKDRKKNKAFRIMKNRGYRLPIEAYENCLNIFCSYSGNTEETLGSLKEAIKNNLPVVGMANGGKLAEICRKNNLPLVVIPYVSQPRYATGYFFASLLQLLCAAGLINNPVREILDSISALKKITRQLESKGRSIAQKSFAKTPVIHTSDALKAVGRIWKIKVNENAKTPCFFNYYPELNHNEMVGYTLPQAKFHIITLLDKNDHPQISKRMTITPKLIEKKGLTVTSIDVPDDSNKFLTIFSSLALADWMSYYLALGYGQDPTPVDMVEDLKKMLV